MVPPTRRLASLLAAVAVLSRRPGDAFNPPSPKSRPLAARTALRGGENEPEAAADRLGGGPRRTLYDVLRCPPDATREELKRSYVRLARDSEPDSILGRRGGGDGGGADDSPSFNEITRAWRTLDDPKERKRYDRSILSERFMEGVAGFAGQVSEEVVPVASRILGEVAAPFVRRTAAAAAAGLRAAASRTGAGGDPSALVARRGEREARGRAVVETVARAVRKKERAMERAGANYRLVLLEKSLDLERRSREITFEAEAVRGAHAEARDRRVRRSIRDPALPLSSSDARRAIGLWLAGPPSQVELAVRRRDGLTGEIELLEEFERVRDRLGGEAEEGRRRLEAGREVLRRAESRAVAAKEAELRAKEALLCALEVDIASRQAVADAAEALEVAEADLKAHLASVAPLPPVPKLPSPAVNDTHSDKFFFLVHDEASSDAIAATPPAGPVFTARSVVMANGVGACPEGYLDPMSSPGATSQATGDESS